MKIEGQRKITITIDPFEAVHLRDCLNAEEQRALIARWPTMRALAQRLNEYFDGQQAAGEPASEPLPFREEAD